MPSPTTDDLLEPSRRNRRVIRGFVFLLLFLVGIAFYLYFFFDLPRPDDSDFALGKSPSATQDTAPIQTFLDQLAFDEFPHPSNLGQTKSLEPAMVEDFARRSHAAIQKLLQTDPETLRWTTETEAPSESPSPDRYPLNAWSTTYLAAIQSRPQLTPEESVRICLDLVHVGHRLSESADTFEQLHAALELFLVGASALPRVVSMHDLTSQELQTIQVELEALEPSPAAIGRILKHEYRTWDHALDEVSQGSRPLASLPQEMIRPRQLSRLRLKPQMTRTGLLEVDRQLLNALNGGWHAARKVVMDAGFESVAQMNTPYPFHYHMNAVGISCIIGHHTALVRPLYTAMDAVATHRQVILQLALRRFEISEGRLPGDLRQLTPNPLRAVPVDPYADRPMSWNSSTQTLYSVGANIVDDGGIHSPRPGEGDITYPYWWMGSPPSTPSTGFR